jgi:16S rRNA (cytidine1402-2'-O)-methyltransferase
MPGSHFVVATPIGNLEDLTFRALRVLGTVDSIAAEDTRRTAKLLSHNQIRRPLVSLHEHNEYREAPRLARRIQEGETIALVCDAGTPAISDPGTLLVRACRQAGLPVIAVPGPSAVTAALSVTGVPAVPFTFMGFPPASGRDRVRWFEQAAEAPGTLVLFEAPHRLRKTLADAEQLGIRTIYVHREITKIHETLAEWHIGNGAQSIPVEGRGEIVIVLGPKTQENEPEVDDSKLLEVLERLESLEWLSAEQVLSATAAATGLRIAKVRSRVKKARILVKRRNI